MYLSKLEIQGFKSFAEKAVLEFNHDLTAIVGPNGSGKSNITDAIRWVLGEQSLKLLRGKKSGDVIFSGSQKKARLGFAEVNLYLNNEDHSASIDYQEVLITRRIYRDGENEYLINKNKVRLSDVQLLLAKTNFGQRTYAIIGQGMIDSILTASPQERKNFFDEATGVLQYQIKKEQALNKLEHSQENLEQSQRLLAEIEPRLRSLNRQVKKLERREGVAKNLLELQNRYYSYLYHDLTNQQTSSNEKLTKLETEKKHLETQLKEGQLQLEQLQHQDTQADAFQKLQEQLSYLSNQKNNLLQELALVKGKIDLDLTKLGKVDLVWAKHQQAEIDNNLSFTEKQLTENSSQIEKLSEQLEEKTNQQQELSREYQKLQEHLFQVQKSLASDDSLSLSKIQNHLNSLYQKQQQFLKTISTIKDLTQLSDLKKAAEEITQETSKLIERIKDDNKADWQEMTKIQTELSGFLTNKDSLISEIQNLKINLEIAKQKEKQFTEQRQKLTEEKRKIELEFTSTSGQSTINQKLLQQKLQLEEKISEIDSQLEEGQKQLAGFSQQQHQSKNKFFSLQKNLRDLQIKLDLQNNEYQELKISLAKIETKKEDLDHEVISETDNNFKLIPEKISLDLGEASAEINRFKNQLAIIGGIDQEVIKEHQEVKSHYDFLKTQSIDLEKAITACRQIIEELEEKIKKQFESAFEKINEHFSKYFRILFNGGKAKLILQKKQLIEEEPEISEDQEDQQAKDKIPATKKKYEIGIEIQATPPGKKLNSLNVLSGGEKALTSIALISAIIAQNPPPFVVLDEVDAALDEANSGRFIKIIDDLSHKTQFICITHNRVTMQQAAILYGITMGDDSVSKLLSINLTEAEKVAA
ncbi:AAA family ATPase [Patescibacteria group bacterium]|nr:AAA family ATPase [Patescibacteria group bacterium]